MRSALLVAFLATSACASSPQATITADAACVLEAGDKAWLTRAPTVWPLVSKSSFKLQSPDPRVTYVLFDSQCTYTSKDAQSWAGALHAGKVALPDGGALPPQVTSFAAPAPDGSAMMVIALPTIWNANGVKSDLGVERLMFAVLAHEMTHTRQFPDYGDRLDALAAASGAGDDLDDNIIQDRFKSDAAFAAAVARETELFFAAAAETDNAKARALATEALASIDARRKQSLSGDNASLGELEDIFLTMEGSGQFAAFSWLSNPAGGGLDRAAAHKGLIRGKVWSQDEGLALFMALDRLAPNWPSDVFAARPKSALSVLSAAIR